MRRSRKFTLAAAMSLCLAFGSVPALAADTVDALPEIQDSSTINTKPVASGVLTDAAGVPLGKGKLVVLYAWPNNEFLANMAVNESAKIVPVAKATTRADGKFDIRIADPKLLNPLKSKDGQVELTLRAENGSDLYSHSFSRRMDTALSATVYKDPGTPVWIPPVNPGKEILGGGAAAESSIGLPAHNETETLNVKLSPAGAGGNTAGGSEPSAVIGEQYAEKAACTAVKKTTYTPRWVVVGQSYVDNIGVWADFGFNNGVTSTLGIGFSASGAYGSYSVGGSSSVSASGTIDFPRQGRYTHKLMRTKFTFAQFNVLCVNFLGQIVGNSYEVRPVSWAGGSDTVNSGYTPAARYCVPFAKGSYFSKEKSRAVTWTDGAAIKGAIGVDLSSQTGYSTKANAAFQFIDGRSLCGSNAYPGESPVFLTVK